MSQSEWTPQRARAKRPMPIWVDVFVKDTIDLEADEIGAYFLLLAAMWSRPQCSFPNDDHKLARVCRVSVTKWRRSLSKKLLPFLQVTESEVISKRLQKEACFCERSVTGQRCRKTGENPDNYLKTIGVWSTADITTAPNHGQSAVPTYLQTTVKRKKTNKKKKNKNQDLLPLFAGQEKPPETPEPEPGPFDIFWAQYPHRGGAKRGRAAAEAKFSQAVKRGVPVQTIIDAAIRFRRDRKAVDGFAPDPSAWLHQRGWEDEIEPINGSRVHSPDDPEREKKRIEILSSVADAMTQSGKDQWVVGSRFVTDSELKGIWELGLAPDKIGKKT